MNGPEHGVAIAYQGPREVLGQSTEGNFAIYIRRSHPEEIGKADFKIYYPFAQGSIAAEYSPLFSPYFPMSWVKEALKGLADNREVTVQPFGGSMRGRIESGQLVTIEPVVFATIQLNDVIFVKWGDNYLLHLVTAIGDGQIEIGNNLGKINGRVPEDRVLGRVVAVRDEATTVGTVVEHLNGFSFRVTLDSGTTVVARVSKSLARDMFAIRPGDRLRIGGLWNQQYRVLGFERSA